ncbi:MAG TPA: CaiB/BaiF CoA-transferase family protein [Ramlibacter sp.]|nr:CaiB/BaiF CoA-transferase family protein [Ramlibacter sp.]
MTSSDTQIPQLPLAGIKVLDFGRVISGPFVGQVMADLGADVVKVERLQVGDETRSYGPTGRHGESSLFNVLNRNKRSLSIDLGQPQAREVVQRLLREADVLVHNFRPGVMEKLGFGPDDVWKVNPRVVYCAISGFGNRGPMKKRPANDVIAQAFAGLMSFTGDADGPPVRVPVPVADYTAGLFALVGTLSALVERSHTGRGRLVETSLLEGMLALECMHIGDFLATGKLPLKLASGNMLGQPNQAFRTRDGAAVIAAVNDDMWKRCAAALGAPELASDERFATGPRRLERKDELAGIVEALTLQLTTEECVLRLEAAGVTCSPIHDIAQIASHPHVQELGILQPTGMAEAPGRMVGSPLLVDGQRPTARRGAPRLGQDGREILREAGFDQNEIDALHAAGVLFPNHE